LNINPSLDGRDVLRTKKKNGCPHRAKPLRFVFLRPGTFRCPAGFTRLAMTPVSNERKPS
jgi:hypothetical protein